MELRFEVIVHCTCLFIVFYYDVGVLPEYWLDFDPVLSSQVLSERDLFCSRCTLSLSRVVDTFVFFLCVDRRHNWSSSRWHLLQVLIAVNVRWCPLKNQHQHQHHSTRPYYNHSKYHENISASTTIATINMDSDG